MADMYTGISVLKRINSLLKGKVNSPLLPIGRSKQVTAINQLESTPGPEKIITPQVKANNDIHIVGVKDKKINELICRRLTCEKAVRLKQEIKNFSSVWLSRLS
jgi:RAB protein geranylgeranyltransferase component A